MGDIADISRPECSPVGLDRALAALAARQHGVVALAQLRSLGLGERGVRHRVTSGRLHRVHRGVYAVGHAGLSRDGRWLAAVLACGPGAALSHRSAAAAWGLRPTSRVRIEVTASRSRRGLAGVQVHRPRALHDADVTQLRGIRVTTVARTLVDLAGVLQPQPLERAVHEAEVLRLLDVTQVHAALERAPGRKGTKALRTILSMPGHAPTRSILEDRFRQLCHEHDLPQPRMNTHLEAGDRLIEVDALWPRERLIVELDGAAAHHTTRAFHQDRRRDAALAADGYLTVRLTWSRVAGEAAAVAAELRRTLATRDARREAR